MGLFDWFKKKETKQKVSITRGLDEERIKLQRKIFEESKNKMLSKKQLGEYLKKMNKEAPTHMVYQDVKNSEEFQARWYALNYSMLKEYDKAIEWSTKGIKINPKSAYLYYIRGRTKGDMGLFKEGIEDLNVAIKLKPKISDAYRERGEIKKRLGDIKGGEEDCRKSEEMESIAQQWAETKRMLNE